MNGLRQNTPSKESALRGLSQKEQTAPLQSISTWLRLKGKTLGKISTMVRRPWDDAPCAHNRGSYLYAGADLGL